MKKFLYVLTVIALLIVGYYLYIYWALGNDSEAQPIITSPIVGENLEGEADPSRMSLTMTTWRWQNAIYNDGREVKPNRPETFTLKFNDDGTFSVTTDCNNVGGKYNSNGESLSFTEIYTTLMYCEGSQETEFVQLLNNTNNYHFTSRGELILNLKFDSGSAVFR